MYERKQEIKKTKKKTRKRKAHAKKNRNKIKQRIVYTKTSISEPQKTREAEEKIAAIF